MVEKPTYLEHGENGENEPCIAYVPASAHPVGKWVIAIGVALVKKGLLTKQDITDELE